MRKMRRFHAKAVLAAALAGATGTVWIASAMRPTAAEWSASGKADGALPVMSFNVLRGGRPTSETLDAIAQAHPDVVCLQELTMPFAAAFERRFGKTYPHRLFDPGRTVGGIGIASRTPLADEMILELGLPTLPAAVATLDQGSARVRIACIHLMPPHAGFGQGGDLVARYRRNKALRLRQAQRLVDALDRDALPAVILGDMNEWQGQGALAYLAGAGFADACSSINARCGATWPGAVIPLPAVFRIDHILGRGIAFSDAAVLQAGGSDHFPVAARIAATPKQQMKVARQ